MKRKNDNEIKWKDHINIFNGKTLSLVNLYIVLKWITAMKSLHLENRRDLSKQVAKTEADNKAHPWAKIEERKIVSKG